MYRQVGKLNRRPSMSSSVHSYSIVTMTVASGVIDFPNFVPIAYTECIGSGIISH